MTTSEHKSRAGVSRRGMFGIAAAGAVAASAIAMPAQAQTKISQKLSNYQATPKGSARCDGCTQWQGPASCKVVAGVIAPSGWCSLYAPKPKS